VSEDGGATEDDGVDKADCSEPLGWLNNFRPPTIATRRITTATTGPIKRDLLGELPDAELDDSGCAGFRERLSGDCTPPAISAIVQRRSGS
jgi:hypothetical protein